MYLLRREASDNEIDDAASYSEDSRSQEQFVER